MSQSNSVGVVYIGGKPQKKYRFAGVMRTYIKNKPMTVDFVLGEHLLSHPDCFVRERELTKHQKNMEKIGADKLAEDEATAKAREEKSKKDSYSITLGEGEGAETIELSKLNSGQLSARLEMYDLTVGVPKKPIEPYRKAVFAALTEMQSKAE